MKQLENTNALQKKRTIQVGKISRCYRCCEYAYAIRLSNQQLNKKKKMPAEWTMAKNYSWNSLNNIFRKSSSVMLLNIVTNC